MSSEEGLYLYGIIASNKRQDFGPIGIGGRGDTVYTLPYQDIAVILSRSPIIKYHVNRDNVSAHTQVLETAAREYIVLPIRFCTIAESEDVILEKLLKPRYQELIDLIAEMTGKIELGVRARWKNMDAIFAEVVEENKEIKQLKEATLHEKNKQKYHANSVKAGEMVEKTLEKKRQKETQLLLDALKPLSIKWKENKLYGDMNILNAAFLVAKEQEGTFDKKINELQNEYQERTLLIYSSSPVPYSFVELVVKW